MEDSRRAWPTESARQGSHGLTETDAASLCLHGSCVCMLVMELAWCSCGTLLNCGMNVSLTLLPELESFSCWVALYGLGVRALDLSYCTWFCLGWLLTLGLFSEGKQKSKYGERGDRG